MGDRAVGWLENEISEWIEQKVNMRVDNDTQEKSICGHTLILKLVQIAGYDSTLNDATKRTLNGPESLDVEDEHNRRRLASRLCYDVALREAKKDAAEKQLATANFRPC